MRVAVVDANGVLVDNLSVRDLRIIGDHLQHFLRLYLTVATFKATCRHEFARQTPAKPITVTEKNTIQDCQCKEQVTDSNLIEIRHQTQSAASADASLCAMCVRASAAAIQ